LQVLLMTGRAVPAHVMTDALARVLAAPAASA
jgi:hypothetical protein